MTRDEIAQAMNDSAGYEWGNEAHFQSFAALLKDRMIRDGWRQCAVGQRTTQFCGQLEEALKGEREACREIAFRMAHSDEDAVDVSHAIRARGEV
jgi:hypothetical protein